MLLLLLACSRASAAPAPVDAAPPTTAAPPSAPPAPSTPSAPATSPTPAPAATAVPGASTPPAAVVPTDPLPPVANGTAACARTFDTQEIIDAATVAETQWSTMNPAFLAAVETMESRLICVKDQLDPESIARVHRVEVLAAFKGDKNDRVRQGLAGVFAAEPGHQIPVALVPESHPIRAIVKPAMLALNDDPGVLLPVPTSGWIVVDGTSSLHAPTQRSAVMQQIDGQNQVVATHYRWPDDVGFDWLVPVAPSTAPEISGVGEKTWIDTGRRSPWAHRAPLLAVAAASLGTSAALYAMAAHGEADFNAQPVLGPDATADTRDAYRSTLEASRGSTNALTYGCYAAAGAGLALGIVTVITW